VREKRRQSKQVGWESEEEQRGDRRYEKK